MAALSAGEQQQGPAGELIGSSLAAEQAAPGTLMVEHFSWQRTESVTISTVAAATSVMAPLMSQEAMAMACAQRVPVQL